MIWEIVGVIAALFELLGVYLLGKKKKSGFMMGLTSCILWIGYTIATGNAVGLYIICIVAILLDIKGFVQWTKNPPKE